MPEKLDEEKLRWLLVKSDIKWFKEHSDGYKYREHLDFTAKYIAKNYGKPLKKK